MYEVLIPTCKPHDAIAGMVKMLAATASHRVKIIASCQPGSAAFNRNWCLDRAYGADAIMLDDDIDGFYPGWDADLLAPLQQPNVVVVSARLMRPDGRVGPTCSRCYDLSPELIDIEPGDECVLPTAAIAFRACGLGFDEGFLGSGFEDGDWCFQYRKQFPKCRFIQSNKCRLIHRNEMKMQREHWQHNKEYFEAKWKRQPTLA